MHLTCRHLYKLITLFGTLFILPVNSLGSSLDVTSPRKSLPVPQVKVKYILFAPGASCAHTCGRTEQTTLQLLVYYVSLSPTRLNAR